MRWVGALLTTLACTVLAQDPPPVLPETQILGSVPRFGSLREQVFPGAASGLRARRSAWDDPRHVTILDEQALKRRAPQDMVQALEREVGVLVQRTGRGQGSPFLRGLTGPQTLILVDGIRLNNGTFRMGPNQYFNTIDPGQVQSIEVIRGAQSVLWGSDALGGAINVVTRRADRALDGSLQGMGYSLRQNLSSADLGSYTRGSFESAAGGGGLFGGASYLNLNNLERGGDLGRQPFTGYSQYAGDLRYDRVVADDQLLTVALVHLEQADVPRSDKFPGELRVFDPQQRNLAYLRWQGTLTDSPFDAFLVTASYQRMKEGAFRRKPPSALSETRSEFDVGTVGLSLLLVKELGGLGKLTWGTDWYHDDVDAEQEELDLATGVSTVAVPQFPDDSYYERFGTFLEWDVPLAERLQGIAGLRYSHIEAGGTVALFDPTDPTFPDATPVDTPIAPSYQNWSASGSLVYELTDTLRLVGGVAEGFRAPLLDELTSVSNNVNEGVDLPTTGLAPETTMSYDVGVKWDQERFQGQLYYYWIEIDGLIERFLVGTDPDDGVEFFQRRNRDEAAINGLETSGSYRVDESMVIYGNVWYTLGQNTTDGEPVSRIPPAQGVLGLRWQGDEATEWLDLFAWLVTRQDRLSSRDMRDSRIPDGGTPGYVTVNLRYGRRLAEGRRLVLGVENLFDRAYRVHGSGIDGPGISATASYEIYR